MRLRTVCLLLSLWLPAPAWAIAYSGFGPGGLGGALNGQSLTFGGGGSVYELDAFVHSAGAGPATSLSQLAGGAVPDLSIAFGAALSADGTDLLLTYDLTNVGPNTLGGLTFFSFVDAEIAEPTTGFFNEIATASGALAPGQGFEVDEPGYAFGDILDNIANGALDGTNAVGLGSPDDVSMALSFSLGGLDPGDMAKIQIQLSEDGDGLGSFLLTQGDSIVSTTLAYSGQARVMRAAAPIPEPSAALLFATGTAFFFGRSRRNRR